jgi:hypothetical protein
MPRQFEGGKPPLSIPGAPNVVRQFDNSEMISRRGEDALVVQMLPCPCLEEQKKPDCPFCFSGFIRYFQDFIEVTDESANMEQVASNQIYTRFYPIKEVSKITLFQDRQSKPLPIKSIKEKYIELPDNHNLKYWNKVLITYRAINLEEITIEGNGNNDFRVILPIGNRIIVGIKDYYSESGLTPIGFTFDSLLFSERSRDISFKVILTTVPPTKVLYRIAKVEKEKTQKASIKLETGDIEIGFGDSDKVTEGDIVTLLKMYFTTSNYIRPNKNVDWDYIPFAPVKEIFTVFSKTDRGLVEHKQGTDFILESQEKIRWLTPRPDSGYTIRYSYHPSYRLQNSGEGGGNENRLSPRFFVGKPVPSYRSFQ